MTVVSNFNLIVGDNSVTIGDPQPVWERPFDTNGRDSDYPGYLRFDVRGLTYTDEDVEVKINDVVVGKIYRYGGLSGRDKSIMGKHWYSQSIAFRGSTLNDGDNEIQIEAVGYPDSSADNMYDDFEIKDMVCFFHQSA